MDEVAEDENFQKRIALLETRITELQAEKKELMMADTLLLFCHISFAPPHMSLLKRSASNSIFLCGDSLRICRQLRS